MTLSSGLQTLTFDSGCDTSLEKVSLRFNQSLKQVTMVGVGACAAAALAVLLWLPQPKLRLRKRGMVGVGAIARAGEDAVP